MGCTMRRVVLILFVALFCAGCAKDDNASPKFGKETGLPANCRAYVQFSIDSYRQGKYTADETMTGLERNCGANGSTWKSG